MVKCEQSQYYARNFDQNNCYFFSSNWLSIKPLKKCHSVPLTHTMKNSFATSVEMERLAGGCANVSVQDEIRCVLM